MWSLSLTIPSLLMLSVFLGYCMRNASLPVRRSKCFRILIMNEMLLTVTDIISSVADNNHALYPVWVLVCLNAIYFFLLAMRGSGYVIYTAMVARLNSKEHRHFFEITAVVSGLFVILLTFGPVFKIYNVGTNGYCFGPNYWLIYLQGFGTGLVMLFVLIYYKERFNKHQFYSILVYVAFFIAGYLFRAIFSRVMVMNIFSVSCIAVILLCLQNPGFYLDNRNYLFDQFSLTVYLRECFYLKRRVSIVGVEVINAGNMLRIYGQAYYDQALIDTANYLKQAFPKQNIFYLPSGKYIIADTAPIDRAYFMDVMNCRVSRMRTEKNQLPLGMFCIEDNVQTRNGDEMMNLISKAFHQVDEKVVGSLTIVDEKMIRIMRREDEVNRLLTAAVEQHKVETWLQPIWNVAEQRISGAEALARIRDENGNLVSPGEFIPIAEHTGMVLALGEQVFEASCAFITDPEVKKKLDYVNVNLSTVQCISNAPTNELIRIGERYNLETGKLNLELTEAAMISPQVLSKRMAKIAALGYRFAMDDFGTGLSNIGRLENFPFSIVKIDQSLVRSYMKDKDKSILPHTIEDLRRLGYNVVAEGVETEECAKAMSDLGCTHLQGFYFSRPLPMEEFREKYLQ